MDKNINTIIKKYSDKADLINSLVVTAFLRCHQLEAGVGFLAKFVAKEMDGLETDIRILSANCTIEDVITIFELAIPDGERTANGAVYTPRFIRDYIVSQVLHSINKPLDACLCADVACGCGAFIYTLAENVHEHTHASFTSIYHHLYGVDISKMSIVRAKILLSLVALLHGEIVDDNDFNLFRIKPLSQPLVRTYYPPGFQMMGLSVHTQTRIMISRSSIDHIQINRIKLRLITKK